MLSIDIQAITTFYSIRPRHYFTVSAFSQPGAHSPQSQLTVYHTRQKLFRKTGVKLGFIKPVTDISVTSASYHLNAVQRYGILYGKRFEMNVTKLTVRVPKELLEQAKIYAQENDTSLTRLITAYLGNLSPESDPLAEAPIVRRLTGSLSQEVDVKDYRQQLEEKYGQSN
jgi:hypothetical protein